jgi:heme a synthase
LQLALVAYIELSMSSSVTTTLNTSDNETRPYGQRAVRVWLHIIALMIVAMIIVGGATRLTDSGLSITEWQPIHGVIPPLSETAWEMEFAKYRQIPQYEAFNAGMTLFEFKTIYWWEWGHRLLGRLIGVAFFVPLVFFWMSGRVAANMKAPLVGLFVLGGIQGAVGWWMVTSGLSERTDVSQYRLAIHLTFACVILATIVWLARERPRTRSISPGMRTQLVGLLIVILVFLQIFLGGVVAGLNAGMTFNTWPLMDGALFPSGLFIQEPAWRNFFENVATVQFNHRMVAYLLFAVALLHAFQARGSDYTRSANTLAILVALQAGIGIATLIMVVPLSVALLHQLGAALVLWVAVLHLGRLVDAGRSSTRETMAAA